MRKPVLLLVVGAALVAPVVAVALIIAVGRSAGPQPAFAGEPKPGTDGSLSGVYDVLIHPDDKNVGSFHCIARLDHDAGDDLVKAASQCYIDMPGLNPGSALPDPADGIPGPPPPPPYTTAAPTKLNGAYSVGTDTLNLTGCLANIGHVLGPNLILELTIPNAKAGLPNLQGSVLLFANQSIAQCDAKAPSGDGVALSVNLTLVDPNRDYDADGCTDFQELDKTGGFKCGDDPYNPYDSNQSDYSGIYDTLITVMRADWDKIAGEPIPGFYLHCKADLQQDGKDLTARLYCYIDSAFIEVNPEDEPGVSGDGLPGAPLQALLGDIDDTHTELSGYVNKSDNTIEVWGCVEDRDGNSPLGNLFWASVQDVHTGQGTVDIWIVQTLEDCLNGTPTGDPLLGGASLLQSARQAPKGAGYDSDLDGCPDKYELWDIPWQGGLRDPYNPWDYYNPTQDGVNRLDDIIAVIMHYGLAEGDEGYDTLYDRGGVVIGSNLWNLRPPDGVIDWADIALIVLQYFHDCSDLGGFAATPGGDLGEGARKGLSDSFPLPGYDYVEAVIDAGGGTVSTGTKDAVEAELIVPVGALVGSARALAGRAGAQTGDTVRIAIAAVEKGIDPVPDPEDYLPHLPLPENAPDLLSSLFDLRPDGTEFDPSNPAQLTFTYQESAIPGVFEDAIGVFHFNGSEWEHVPVIARDTGANTITVEITSLSPYGIYEPAVADTDSDGCLDVQENGDVPNQGGQRNALYHWDVFDTPNDANARDKMIRIADILRVRDRYGANGDPGIDPLSSPPETGYHTAFDRGGVVGPNDWDQAPPNGLIRVADILAVRDQYGLTC